MDKDESYEAGRPVPDDDGRVHGMEGGASDAEDESVDLLILVDDEADDIGDLGNLFDDPEGWMSERLDYWSTLPSVAHPTRKAWLLHRIAEATRRFLIFTGAREEREIDPRVPESVWRRLHEEVFGPASTALNSWPPESEDGDCLGVPSVADAQLDSAGTAGAKSTGVAGLDGCAHRTAKARSEMDGPFTPAPLRSGWTPPAIGS